MHHAIHLQQLLNSHGCAGLQTQCSAGCLSSWGAGLHWRCWQGFWMPCSTLAILRLKVWLLDKEALHQANQSTAAPD